MKITGGKFSDHEHGGSCMVCGAWMIDYAIFHHTPSNTYIRTGCDCADHIESGHSAAFNRQAQMRRAAKARTKNVEVATAILEDAGILGYVETMFANDNLKEVIGFDVQNPHEPVWDGSDVTYDPCQDYDREAATRFQMSHLFGEVAAQTLPLNTLWFYDGKFYTLVEMVRNLVKYGKWSDKQVAFARRLVEELTSINETVIKQQMEREAMTPAPEGRLQVTGEVLSTKYTESYYGTQFKMLVKDDRNFKVWSTIPSSICEDIEKGSRITFTATLEQSDDDESFAFAKRPTKASFVQEAA